MAKLFDCKFDSIREDDYVEYFVFPLLPENLVNVQDDSAELHELRSRLSTFETQCIQLINEHVEKFGYIWHKDALHLQVRTECKQERLLNDEVNHDSEVPLPPHLHGITHYGDSIADEWYIVYLLRELTRQIPGCVVRVVDSDGEFLLIEAAEVLPKWANPDTCEQRVYMADGYLQLVQNSPSNTPKIMPVAQAIAKIRQNSTLYRSPKDIQDCIGERLREFKEPINSALHRQIVRLPLGVAALLKECPSLIAPAIRTFCDRDQIDMKACRSMRLFPPEQCVRSNVCFTRCLYAMVMHSNYVPDKKIGWNLSGFAKPEEQKEALLGIKIASGFEILAAGAKSLSTDNDDRSWRAYLKSLTGKGYFRNNLEGSEEYKRLLNEARIYYQHSNKNFSTTPVVGKQILDMLQSMEISPEQFCDEENNLPPSDSDDWLNITSEELDAILMERYGPKKLYKSNGEVNAAEFTKNLTDFLEKQSEYDGIENDSDHDESTSHGSYKQDDYRTKVKKNKSMRKACMENPVIRKRTPGDQLNKKGQSEVGEEQSSTHVRNFLDFVIPEDKWDSNSDMSDYEDDDDLERNFEAMASSEKNIDVDIKAYMAQMDKELAKTTIGQSFPSNAGTSRTKASTSKAPVDDFDDIESFEPININVNALKNIMSSYKSQLGGAGPVTNLFNAMGVGMSAATTLDSDDDEDLADLKESRV